MLDFLKRKKKDPVIRDVMIMGCERACPKSIECPKWVVLKRRFKEEGGAVTERELGRCAIAWLPDLITELLVQNGKKGDTENG